MEKLKSLFAIVQIEEEQIKALKCRFHQPDLIKLIDGDIDEPSPALIDFYAKDQVGSKVFEKPQTVAKVKRKRIESEPAKEFKDPSKKQVPLAELYKEEPVYEKGARND